MAELHPELQKDCLLIGRFTLCRLLLMRDANYPWFILVPDRTGIAEIFELSERDQRQLLRESSRLAAILAARFNADKLNIAALGNVVPQLHIHHIVRYRDDPAWPAPVWGRVPPRPYSPQALSAVLATVRSGLRENQEYFEEYEISI
jgi:diadenosine tetraphosphate (Ap4A) HIT family hydrolase